MTVAAVALGRFDIGRVFTRAFEVIRGNFVPFFVLGLVATIPTTAYQVLIAMGQVPGTITGGNSHTITVFFVAAFISLAIGSFLGLILQAALTYGAIDYLRGQPTTLDRAIGVGLRQFFPLMGIGFLEALGLMGGFFLLVFPGFMLYAAWCMVVPVRIAEQTGIAESFSRSRALTAGYRWPIFGSLIILGMGTAAAQAAVRPLIAVGSISASLFVGAVLTGIVTAIAAVASATLHASIYYELRLIKEGVGPQQIAAVFD